MRDEIGQHLPSGIGVGIAENADKALNPIKALNSQILAEAGKLNTEANFSSSFTQTLAPARATAQQSGALGVKATLDPYDISSAIANSFSGMSNNQAPVTLSRESITMLASAIVDSVRVQSRQGVSVLG